MHLTTPSYSTYAPSPYHPSSWRRRNVAQAPDFPDAGALAAVEERLGNFPTLVSEPEVDQLRAKLGEVAEGRAFLLQGGDCAESFDEFRSDTLRDNFKVFLQLAVVLTFGAKRPVVKVGRVAGQYAKPRSSPEELRNDQHLPSYRGDILNGHAFSADDRRHDPRRMERAYFHSAATLNVLRSYAKGGFADLKEISRWNLEFVQNREVNSRYRVLANRIADSIAFLHAVGLAESGSPALETTDFFTSHEALLLNYEEALTRYSEKSKGYFAGSAHMLWIGDRTRQLDGAHVEFLRGLRNPLGQKCGPELDPDELMRLVSRLDPHNIPGRLTLITRLGAGNIESALPRLIRRIQREGRKVIWSCDPMHGNTTTSPSGVKTRSFDDILAELRSFRDIHAGEGTFAGGVHLELTGKNVTECTGGGQRITNEQLTSHHYETLCDPRLNASQALELAFELVP